MGSTTVKLPDDMEKYATGSGQYLNSSEVVRDAVRHLIEERPLRLSPRTRREIEISEEQFERGETVSHDNVKRRLGVE
jgi:Arc/MetJ-type ribon-helix-helix transcriptional regulator